MSEGATRYRLALIAAVALMAAGLIAYFATGSPRICTHGASSVAGHLGLKTGKFVYDRKPHLSGCR